jgi:hypothetical protein
MNAPDTSAEVGLGVDLTPQDDGTAAVNGATLGGRADLAGACAGQTWLKINGEPAGTVPARLADGSLQLTFPVIVELSDGSTLTIPKVQRTASKVEAPSETSTLENLIVASYGGELPEHWPTIAPADMGDAEASSEPDSNRAPEQGGNGTLTIVSGDTSKLTLAERNRSRLGLGGPNEHLQKFLANQEAHRRDINRHMIGSAVSSGYQPYHPSNLYD